MGTAVALVAKEDLENTNQIYDDNKTGISFVADWRPLSDQEMLTLMGELAAIIGSMETSVADPISAVCNVMSELESSGWYAKDRSNVYYLPVPGTGMICPDDPNVVFIALNRKPATLAHELGHSLSLLGAWGHTNDVPGFGPDNVMWTGAPDVRDHFSLGQAFRQNLEPASSINVNQVSQGPTRSCPLTLDSSACPPLVHDWPRP